MKIKDISDEVVLLAIGKSYYGKATYHIRNIIDDEYAGIDTPSVLRKLKDMELRGLVERLNKPIYKRMIMWNAK